MVIGQKIRVNGKRYTVKDVIEIGYTLHDFLAESKKNDPLIFWIARSWNRKEIYIGNETVEEIRNMFMACNVHIDTKDYYYIDDIKIC